MRNSLNKYIPLILFLFVFGINISFANPASRQGLLDLTKWDFQRDGTVQLNGEWQFFWNEFVPPEKFQTQKTANHAYINVPGTWNRTVIGGQTLGSEGYGTYFLKIKFGPQSPQVLALKLPTVGTAYVLFINGQKVTIAGTIGKDRVSNSPAYHPHIITQKRNGEKVWNVVFHMSNFEYKWAGIWYPLILGEVDDIYDLKASLIKKDIFFGGVF